MRSRRIHAPHAAAPFLLMQPKGSQQGAAGIAAAATRTPPPHDAVPAQRYMQQPGHMSRHFSRNSAAAQAVQYRRNMPASQLPPIASPAAMPNDSVPAPLSLHTLVPHLPSLPQLPASHSSQHPRPSSRFDLQMPPSTPTRCTPPRAPTPRSQSHRLPFRLSQLTNGTPPHSQAHQQQQQSSEVQQLLRRESELLAELQREKNLMSQYKAEFHRTQGQAMEQERTIAELQERLQQQKKRKQQPQSARTQRREQ